MATIENMIYRTPPCTHGSLGTPWNRGRSAQAWAIWADPDLSLTTAGCKFGIALASIVLVSLPCCLALVVSYRTPAVGPGCRSTSIMLYWTSQVLLILLHTMHTCFPASRALLYVVATPALVVSFTAAVGGTVLQISGIFVNVYCLAGVRSLLDPDNPTWMLDLATDTLLVRGLARYRWRYTGVAGLVFLCAVCVAASWYQNGVRKRCAMAIEGRGGG